MMWIFEWDIVTGDSAALDSIYRSAATARLRDRRGRRGGRDGRADARAGRRHRRRAPGATRRCARRSSTPSTTRWTCCGRSPRTGRWSCGRRSGSTPARATAHDQWPAAARASTARARRARRALRGDVDLPAYNFTAADLGSDRADRDLAMAWLARGAARARARLARSLGLVLRARRLGRGPGAAAARRAGSRPPVRGGRARSPPRQPRADRVLLVAVPAVVLVASRVRPDVVRRARAPRRRARRLAGARSASCWALVRGRDPCHLVGGLGGVLLRTVCARCRAVAAGPGGYWFGFWTDPAARTVYITVAFAVFCGCSSRPAGRWRHRGSAAGRAGTVLAAVGAGLAVPAVSSARRAGGALTAGTTRWRCCRGGFADPRHHRRTSASPPTPRGGPRGSGRVARGSAARARAAEHERVGCHAGAAAWPARQVAGQRRPPPRMPPSTSPMMLPASNPPAAPPPADEPDAAPTPPVAPPSTSRSRSSSEPGALPPPAARQRGRGVGLLRRRCRRRAAAATLEHPVGQPGQHHRREDRQQLLDQVAAEAGAADRRQPAEPVDDLVLLVAEDVARDGLPSCSSIADRSAPPVSRSSSCWPSACEDRARRRRGRRRWPGAHRAGRAARPLRRCAPRRGRPRPAARSGRPGARRGCRRVRTWGSFRRRRTCSAPCANLAAGEPEQGPRPGHRRSGGCMIGV